PRVSQGGFMLRPSFTCFVLVVALTASLMAQTQSKEGTATISGRVLLKGEPATNAVVGLQPQAPGLSSDFTKIIRVRTEADGRFRFVGLMAGQYSIGALAPGYLSPYDMRSGNPGKVITVADGESVENIELTLKRGGVIAGRISDSSGRSVVEIEV